MKIVSHDDFNRICKLMDEARALRQKAKNPRMSLADKLVLLRDAKAKEAEYYRLAQ
jgi:hypothetical protein